MNGVKIHYPQLWGEVIQRCLSAADLGHRLALDIAEVSALRQMAQHICPREEVREALDHLRYLTTDEIPALKTLAGEDKRDGFVWNENAYLTVRNEIQTTGEDD